MKKGIIILITCFFLSGALFALDNDEHWRKLIELSNEEVYEALLSYDIETILSIFDEDATFMGPMEPATEGKKALKKKLLENREKGVKYHSMTGNILNVWGCEDYIYERGTIAFSLTAEGMSHPAAYYGSYFTVWLKQKDGSYKIKYHIWNLDFNPWEK